MLWMNAGALRKGVGHLMAQVNGKLNTAGVIFREFSAPEQRIPETDELQALFAPISVKSLDMENGLIQLKNHHFFINLTDYEIDWTLQRVGSIVASGKIRQRVLLLDKSSGFVFLGNLELSRERAKAS